MSLRFGAHDLGCPRAAKCISKCEICLGASQVAGKGLRSVCEQELIQEGKNLCQSKRETTGFAVALVLVPSLTYPAVHALTLTPLPLCEHLAGCIMLLTLTFALILVACTCRRCSFIWTGHLAVQVQSPARAGPRGCSRSQLRRAF